MKFIVDLFKPKNEINDLYAEACKKVRKKEAAEDKKRTAYLNRISRKVKWTAKKKELATVPVIKFILQILKSMAPKKREGLFSIPDDFNTNFTTDDINRLYSKAVNQMEAKQSAKRKKQKAYLARITAKVQSFEHKQD